MKLYTIRDKKAQVYLRPFVSENDVTAMRSFVRLLAEKDNPLAQWPDEFAICVIGEWREKLGVIEAEGDGYPVEIMTGRTAIDMLGLEAKSFELSEKKKGQENG